MPSSAGCLSPLFSQTFLEQSKTRFSKNYKGMSLSKITTTVGLNSKGIPEGCGHGGPLRMQECLQPPALGPSLGWFFQSLLAA